MLLSVSHNHPRITIRLPTKSEAARTFQNPPPSKHAPRLLPSTATMTTLPRRNRLDTATPLSPSLHYPRTTKRLDRSGGWMVNRRPFLRRPFTSHRRFPTCFPFPSAAILPANASGGGAGASHSLYGSMHQRRLSPHLRMGVQGLVERDGGSRVSS